MSYRACSYSQTCVNQEKVYPLPEPLVESSGIWESAVHNCQMRDFESLGNGNQAPAGCQTRDLAKVCGPRLPNTCFQKFEKRKPGAGRSAGSHVLSPLRSTFTGTIRPPKFVICTPYRLSIVRIPPKGGSCSQAFHDLCPKISFLSIFAELLFNLAIAHGKLVRSLKRKI